MEITQLLIVLVIILALVKIAGVISVKFGQPAVFGQLLTGLLLGPAVFGVLEPHEAISFSAEIGVILMMFLVGLETNIEEMKKVGMPAVMGGFGGVIGSFVLGFVAARYVFSFDVFISVFIGVLLTATSVSISAQTLVELGHIQSKEGRTILGAAIVDDILGIILLSIVLGFHGGGEINIFLLIGKMITFFVGAVILGQKLLPPLIKYLRINGNRYTITSTALIVCFFYSWFAEWFGGVATITGAYIAGVCFVKSDAAHEIEENISMLANSFFVPIFFVNVGLQAKKFPINGQFIYYAVLIVVIAVISKVGGSGLGTFWCRFNVLESLRVGIGMVSRGEVALIMCSIGLSMGFMSQEVFSLMIVMTIATTLLTPLLLKVFFGNATVISKTKKIDSVVQRKREQFEKYLQKQENRNLSRVKVWLNIHDSNTEEDLKEDATDLIMCHPGTSDL